MLCICTSNDFHFMQNNFIFSSNVWEVSTRSRSLGYKPWSQLTSLLSPGGAWHYFYRAQVHPSHCSSNVIEFCRLALRHFRRRNDDGKRVLWKLRRAGLELTATTSTTVGVTGYRKTRNSWSGILRNKPSQKIPSLCCTVWARPQLTPINSVSKPYNLIVIPFLNLENRLIYTGRI